MRTPSVSRRCASILLVVAALSCSSDGSKTDIYGGGSSGDPGGGDGSTGGSTDDGGGDDGSSDDGGGDGGVKFDTPAGDTDGGPGGDDEGEGCEGLDFLFVIDNSGSMEDNQLNLINSFPGFMQTLREKVGESGENFHLMVTDTDATGGCVEFCEAFGGGGGSATCNGVDCSQIPAPPAGDPCETTLGAGRVTSKVFEDCGLASGARFMDQTQPDLEQTFACVAEVGILGNGGEQPIGSLNAALSDQLNQPGQCNEGFLRDDAVLVVTIITDEEEEEAPGDPMGWHASVLATKGGNETAIVMLGLLTLPGCPEEEAPLLRQFVEAFGDRGVVGSVCEPDYSPFFEEATAVIEFACEEFDPQG
jgi:hypothetical protein